MLKASGREGKRFLILSAWGFLLSCQPTVENGGRIEGWAGDVHLGEGCSGFSMGSKMGVIRE